MADEDGAVEWEKPEWWHDARFQEFENWLIDGPAGEWRGSEDLSSRQREIISANAALLTANDGGSSWARRVQAFEAAINSLKEEYRQVARAAFHIRFDLHDFSEELNNFSGYRFPCSVSFDGATFGDGKVSFDKAMFGDGDVRFSGVDFGGGEVWFAEATFGNGDVSFARAKFGEGLILFNKARLTKRTFLILAMSI